MLSKALEPSDYEALGPGLRAAYHSLAWCQGMGVPIALPHEHRMWEYASVLTALKDVEPGRVLDVGSGNSLLGPAMCITFSHHVTEIDPSPNTRAARVALAGLLADRGYEFHPTDLVHFDALDETFDVVTSISVMEHLPDEEQEESWHHLVRLLRPGGLLLATVDYGEEGRPWENDSDRGTRFTKTRLEEILAVLVKAGIHFEGIDTAYTGDQVFDYTFFRIIGSKA